MSWKNAKWKIILWTWNQFYLKDKRKRHHENIWLSMILPERATDPPRRQPPPTRRRTMPPRRTTPPRTRRPGQYTQHYTHCSAVCAFMPLYILTVEIRSSDNTASITCTVAVMIWQYKYEILYFICKYVECVAINNQVLLSSNCVILLLIFILPYSY